MNEEIKKPEISTALRKVIEIFYDAIAVSGEEGIPSDHLYAMVMGKLSLETYNNLIALMKGLGLITERDFLLRAVRRGERG